MVNGEPVCGLLLEGVKQGGEARLRSVVTWEVAEGVLRATPEMISLVGHIRRAAEKASRSGSKLEHGKRLAASHRSIAAEAMP
jgi:hypothetical protein